MQLRMFKWIATSLALAALAACATQPHAHAGAEIPGFLLGVWHGFAAPLALVAELFTENRIYAFPNAGGWYDLGFIIGIGAWGGGAASAR